MTAFYIKKLKYEIHFQRRMFTTFLPAFKFNALKIDLIVAEPDAELTYVENRVIGDESLTLLHVTAWDFLTVCTTASMMGKDPERLFYGSAEDALRTVCRAAWLKISAPGDCAYYRNIAIRSNPAGWKKLNDHFNAKGHRNGKSDS